MYNVDFTGTGRMTLHNFNPKEQKQILLVLDKIASNYEGKAPDNKQIRYLGDEFYVIKINNTISVMIKIQDATFKIIDVFRHTRSESLAHI